MRPLTGGRAFLTRLRRELHDPGPIFEHVDVAPVRWYRNQRRIVRAAVVLPPLFVVYLGVGLLLGYRVGGVISSDIGATVASAIWVWASGRSSASYAIGTHPPRRRRRRRS